MYEPGTKVRILEEFRGAGLRNPEGTVIANPVVRPKHVYEGHVDIRTDAGESVLGLSFEQIEPA